MSQCAVEELRRVAARLLSAQEADVVLGFERGTLPLRSRPVFVHRAQEARRLVCDGFCESNLACYLPDLRSQRTAVVARGCESRSIATLLAERQVEREKLLILGLPCRGIVDRRRLEAAAPGEILAAEDQGDEIVLYGHGWERRIPRQACLSRSCQACASPNPERADLLLAGPVPAPTAPLDPAAELDALAPAERWARFATETERCLRCYACRQACPLCYCPECFVDHSQPRWCDSGTTAAGREFWHIMRAYHHAGRCALCGACERACPVGIPLLHLTAGLGRIAREVTATMNGGQGDGPRMGEQVRLGRMG